jgi:hypothetical protein
LAALGQNSSSVPNEAISPELVLVDPDLRARAQAALPDRVASPVRPPPAQTAAPVAAAPAEERHRRTSGYPLWARITATLWILVIGILIGGTAVPHAQDRPRVVPPAEDATICERPQQPDTLPTRPLGPIGGPGSP